MKQRAFDESAEGWDAASVTYERAFAPFTAQFAQDVVRFFPPRESHNVLELAAGSGSLTHELAKHAASVLATDISPLMIARLAESMRDHGHRNVRAAVMDAHALNAADESYDAVYCMFGVMFFSDVQQALREMVRVLKTGGTCVVTTWTPRSGVLRPLAGALNAAAPGSPPAQALSSPPVLGTLDELQREFTAAGLSAVEVHEATQVLRLPSRDAYMGELLRANPNGILMEQRLPPQLYSEVRAQVDAQLQAQFGDGPVILEGVANVAAAAKT